MYYIRTLQPTITTTHFTNLEKTPMNRSQQLSTPYKRLIDPADSSKTLKTNNGRLPRWATYNLTNNKRLLNCDKKRIETQQ